MSYYIQYATTVVQNANAVLTLPAAPTVGNTLVLIVAGWSNTPTAPTGFTTVGGSSDASNQSIWVFSRVVVAGDPAAWTCPAVTDVHNYALIEFYGAATISLPAHGAASVAGSVQSTSSLTAVSALSYRIVAWESDVRGWTLSGTNYSYDTDFGGSSFLTSASYGFHSAVMHGMVATGSGVFTLTSSTGLTNPVFYDIIITSPVPPVTSIPVNAPLFYAAEIDAYLPSSGSGTLTNQPWDSTPWNALTLLPYTLESYSTIYVSDFGYRTEPPTVVRYPPLLASAFSLDRKLNLDPSKPSAAAGWGSLTIQNPGNQFDAIVTTQNTDGRGLRIYAGTKVYDNVRGYFADPVKASLVSLFTGVAKNWFLSDTTLSIPVRDATYFLERSVQTSSYGGTGNLDGGTNLTGKLKPRARGSVQNVSPILVDPVNQIYQWNDGPVTSVTALYEGGAQTITFQSDVSNLYSGTTTSGQYRTNNAQGLFQLGSAPIHQITLDGVATKTTSMANNNIVELMMGLLKDDMFVNSSYIDASFAAVSASFAMLGGYYLTDTTDGATLLGNLAQSIGAQIYPKRNGKLGILPLRAIPTGATSVASLNPYNSISCTPEVLPSPLEPPPKRWQIGYAHNYTLQTSDLNATTPTAHQQFIAANDRFVIKNSSSISTAFRNPSDPPQIPTALSSATDAGTVADAYVALWCVRRRLYNIVVPVAIGVLREIGDVVKVTWPMDNLASGKLGQIVGDSFKGGDATITLKVLV